MAANAIFTQKTLFASLRPAGRQRQSMTLVGEVNWGLLAGRHCGGIERPGRPEHSSGPRVFLEAIVAGLGCLLAAALFLGGVDGELPKPARVEAALAGGGGIPDLCFHGSGGELLGFAPAGQHCR
jgi:hypothetical protein